MKDVTDYGSKIKDYAYCELPILEGGSWLTTQLKEFKDSWLTEQLHGFKKIIQDIGIYLSLVLSIIVAQNIFICFMIFRFTYKIFYTSLKDADLSEIPNILGILSFIIIIMLIIMGVVWYILYWLFDNYVTSNIDKLLEDE